MSKTAIKNFAIRARHRLIEAAKQRACEFGIAQSGETKENTQPVRKGLLTATQIRQRQQLLEEICHKGYHQVIEEAACSCFIRFIALRFMEVNGFQYPMFGKLPEWAELLLPDDLLEPEGVLGQMVTEIPAQAFQNNVQIIGWMYQYYNSELKDDTFAQLKKNVKITKERIPAATQLFTPDWIVRYLVENSLGRIYVNQELSLWEGELSEAQRMQAEQRIASQMGWKYYLPEAEQAFRNYRRSFKDVDIQNIKVIDPCMGAGHILAYAFDVLMQIYLARGWSEQDAAKSILAHNLYGLDIDKRAGQLSSFTLMMKARAHHSEILNGEIRPAVLAIQDAGFLTDELIDDVADSDETVKAKLMLLRSVFEDAGEYGSLLDVPLSDFSALYERIDTTRYQKGEAEQLLALVHQAQILSGKYDVVVTNPPYMGISGMSDKLSRFVKAHYPDSKSDLFAVFMERCTRMVSSGGYLAMITQHSWMFLRSFSKLRKKLLAYDTVNMAHLGARAFEGIAGSVVQTTSFVLRNTHTEQYRGTYCRLTAPTTQRDKEKLFLSGEDRYHIAQPEFGKIPGSPVAYWLSAPLMGVFTSGTTVGDIAASKQGIATANNARYLRLWHECRAEDIFVGCLSHEMSAGDERKWYPYNKGGEGRRWYGNHDYVINWYRDGLELRADPKAVIRNPHYFFRSSVSWSLVCPGIPTFRWKPEGQLFDVAGMSCFSTAYLHYLLALFNSKPVLEMLKVLAPTINYQCGDIANIPVKIDAEMKGNVEKLAKSNVDLSKEDWDSFEVSWDFKKHPLL